MLVLVGTDNRLCVQGAYHLVSMETNFHLRIQTSELKDFASWTATDSIDPSCSACFTKIFVVLASSTEAFEVEETHFQAHQA